MYACMSDEHIRKVTHVYCGARRADLSTVALSASQYISVIPCRNVACGSLKVSGEFWSFLGPSDDLFLLFGTPATLDGGPLPGLSALSVKHDKDLKFERWAMPWWGSCGARHYFLRPLSIDNLYSTDRIAFFCRMKTLDFLKSPSLAR